MNFKAEVKRGAPLYYVKFDAKTNAPSLKKNRTYVVAKKVFFTKKSQIINE